MADSVPVGNALTDPASLPVRLLQLPKITGRTTTLKDAIKGTREAYSQKAGGFVPHTVYDRYKLPAGAQFEGPAIAEERESTVIIGEDGTARVDEYGFLWVDLTQARGTLFHCFA